MQVYECSACGAQYMEAIYVLVHQSACPNLDEDKREYRYQTLVGLYGEYGAITLRNIVMHEW